MTYLIVYENVDDASKRRELVVEASDEGGAYDAALEQMGEQERLIQVIAKPA